MNEFKLPADLIDRLRTARYVVTLTGAGISAESGVPTFRDAQTGLWARYDPEQLATPEAFARQPQLVWEWYAWRRELISGARPNDGHRALALWDALFPRFTLITQNIDGLHQAAGSSGVIELHGNINRIKCDRAGHAIHNWRTLPGAPPICPHCGGRLRPDVVWFGESLPVIDLKRAIAASDACDIYFSIGTSSLVQPAASLVGNALRRGATVVEINPDHTPLTDHATFAFSAPSGKILPLITAALMA